VPVVRLTEERELVGMYLSAHPLDQYYMELTYGTTPIKEFVDEETAHVEGKDVFIGGLVVNLETRQGKKGPWGILKIEDLSGTTELRLFGETYARYNGFCQPGAQILITGKYQRRYSSEELSFNVSDITLLEKVKGRFIRGISLRLSTDQINENLCALLREHATSSREDLGELQVRVFAPKFNRRVVLTSSMRVPVNRKFVQTLESLDIEFNVLKN
jgi:DNA polymerase-3 subunit alpha